MAHNEAEPLAQQADPLSKQADSLFRPANLLAKQADPLSKPVNLHAKLADPLSILKSRAAHFGSRSADIGCRAARRHTHKESEVTNQIR